MKSKAALESSHFFNLGIEHFLVVGPGGAVNFWRAKSTTGDWMGGFEVHGRKPFSYQADNTRPSRDFCEMLNGPCWHDGSSLYASETLIPELRFATVEGILSRMEWEYKKQFSITDHE